MTRKKEASEKFTYKRKKLQISNKGYCTSQETNNNNGLISLYSKPV